MRANVRFKFDNSSDIEGLDIQNYNEFINIKFGKGGMGEEFANCYDVGNVLKFKYSRFEHKITKILTQNSRDEICIDITVETLI